MKNEELLELFSAIGKLKSMKRAGWSRAGIPESESVAGHSFRTAFIAMILGDTLGLNTDKLLRMALLHDIPEIITGDITPYDDLDSSDKRVQENNAVNQLLKSIPNGKQYIALWNEFDEQRTPEAKVLKNIDKFEMALQAGEYSKMFPDKDLSEFIDDFRNNLKSSEFQEMFEEIIQDL
jgi:5'-deoxynucleotidase YfbR-like HD superfamily hydrolase